MTKHGQDKRAVRKKSGREEGESIKAPGLQLFTKHDGSWRHFDGFLGEVLNK